jgi:hypothetical protein
MTHTQRIRTRQLLSTALLFLAGAAVGLVAARSGFRPLPELGLTRPQLIIVLAALPVIYLLSVAGHELGHVLAGRLAGFRTLLFMVGPLRLERGPDGFRAGFNRDVLMAGGLAAMAPVGVHDLRRRAVVMVAGGPLASLMIGTQFLALYQATSAFLFRSGAGFIPVLAGITLLAIGMSSLLIGLLTLLPGRSGGFYSDGARLLRLIRASDETEREVALIALTGLTIGGTRPREWDDRLVALGAEIRDGGPFEVGGRQFAYAHALDRGDIEAARHHLEAALRGVGQLPAGSRASLLLAAATFLALYDGDAVRARSYLTAARRGLLAVPHQRLLAEAAVRLAEGDVHGARDVARHVQRLASNALDRGAAALDVALASRILDNEA